MEEELSCTVCQYEFGAEPNKNPRTLSCGHTFCTLCLQKLFRLNNKLCPECRDVIKYTQVSLIPVSITLLRMADAHKQKTQREAINDVNLDKLQHNQKIIKQINYNRKLLFQSAETAKIEINDKLLDLTNQMTDIQQLFDNERYWQNTLRKLYNKYKTPGGGQNNNKNKDELSSAIQWINDVTKQIVCLALGTAKTVWATDRINNSNKSGMRYAKVTKHGNHVLLHALEQKPQQSEIRKDDILVPYGNLRSMADKKYPSTFMEFDWEFGNGVVKMNLDKNNKRAEQFGLLCSGEQAYSYLNSHLLCVTDKGKKGTTIWGGDYEHNDGSGGNAIVNNCNRDFNTSFKRRGIITGHLSNLKKKSAQFGICLIDHTPYKFLGTFGTVTEGLQVLDAMVSYPKIQGIRIKDCGILLPIEVKSYM